MGTKRLTTKLRLLWTVLRSTQVSLLYQRKSGDPVRSGGQGSGSLKDMVLFATEMKKNYNGFVDAINHVAAESGDLHALKELRDAIETLEKE